MMPMPEDWEATRRRILALADNRCARCERTAQYVDHVDDTADHVDANLQALCLDHHREHCRSKLTDPPRRKNRRLRPPEPHPGRIHDLECDCPACTWA